jgi:chromosome partitioning protein
MNSVSIYDKRNTPSGLSESYTNMILAIASQKGGTGKTTTSITLSAGLGKLGYKVLLIDIDSQANASKVLVDDYVSLSKDKTIYSTIVGKKTLSVHPTTCENVDIVPSHILLSETDVELTTARDHREARLKRQLDKIKDEYDHIIIDCPPSLSWLTINAFTASEKILVVISPGYFELDSINQINKTLSEVKELFNPNLALAGYLFNMSDPTNATKVSLKLLRQTYTEDVLKTIIPKNTAFRDAQLMKTNIFSYAPDAKGAHAFVKLISEIYGYGKEETK